MCRLFREFSSTNTRTGAKVCEIRGVRQEKSIFFNETPIFMGGTHGFFGFYCLLHAIMREIGGLVDWRIGGLRRPEVCTKYCTSGVDWWIAAPGS